MVQQLLRVVLRWMIVLLLFLTVVSVLLSPARGRVWHYQLQNYDCNTVREWGFDFVVVDLYEFNCEMPKGTVLAYVSIGEAEDYRWYWEEVGDLILSENREWKGNYAVRFWEEKWKEVVMRMLEHASERGFDGVYLDKVDVVYDIGHEDEMVELVCEVHERAREMGLLVFVQNAPELYDRIRRCVDGIGKEETWFDKGSPREMPWGLDTLRRAREEGKIVLVVEYIKDNVCDFYEKCWKEGFHCTVEDYDLSRSLPLFCEK